MYRQKGDKIIDNTGDVIADDAPGKHGQRVITLLTLCDELEAKITRLKADNARLKADAGRWRWVKANCDYADMIYEDETLIAMTDGAVDAAIDDAIKTLEAENAALRGADKGEK